jgi:hypothetical protein
MLNHQLRELFDNYGESFKEDSKYTIDFVKANRQSLLDLPTIEDVSSFKKYLAIIGRYIKGLVSTGKHNLAIDEAVAFLPVIERNRTQFQLKPTDDNWYLTILFQKACAHNQLKDYAVALKEFKALQAIDLQSDEIKKWIDYSWYGKYQVYNNLIFILGAILIFGDSLLKNHLSENINLLTNFTGLGLWIIYFVVFFRIRKNRRK